MRWLWLLLLIPAAHACSQTEPCVLRVELDEGIALSPGNATQGDWVVFDVWNWHDEARTLELAHYGTQIEAAPFSSAEGPNTRSRAIRLTDAGAFDLRDTTTGESATLSVAAVEDFRPVARTPAVADHQDEPGPEERRVRNVPSPWPLLPLLGAGLLRRRAGDPGDNRL